MSSSRPSASSPGTPRALLAALLRPHWPALSLAFALMLAQSLATLLQPWFGGVVVGRLLAGQGRGSTPLLAEGSEGEASSKGPN